MSSNSWASTAADSTSSRAESFRRHRAWRRASLLLIGAGLALTATAALSGREDAYLLVLPSVMGMILAVANEYANMVGVRLSRDGGLFLTRVHPNFRRAVLEMNDFTSSRHSRT